jgi:2-hydroxychromene-2-carboxylate isomerase
MALEFWFDVVCPYAYVASLQVEALAAAAGTTVDWRPVSLGGVLTGHGTAPYPMDSMSPLRREHTLRDIARTAAFHGAPLTIPAEHPRRTVDAMRVLAALPTGLVPAAAHRLFRAYWIDGLDLARAEVVEAVLRPIDVSGLLEDPAARSQLRTATEAAVREGVFGVPTMRVRDRLQWGVDRLAFVREELGLPEPPLPAPSAAVGLPIEVFYDFASPFAYLGVHRVGAVAERARSEVTYTPILLGALFRELGTADVPLLTFSAARRSWVRRDLHDHAAAAGLPFRFPTTFPLRTVLALRVVLLEPAAREPLFRAAWALDLDIGRPEVVREVLTDAGLDGSLVDRADQARDALRDSTTRARELGVFGVPTFVVAAERWFGQDRLDQVARAARVPPIDNQSTGPYVGGGEGS